MKYRLINKKDDAVVASIIRDCLTEYGGDHRPDTAWADPFLDHFSEVYKEDNNRYWIAENDEGIVVAGVGIGPIPGVEGICELQKMYCRKEYRGRGIASSLLEYALGFARTQYFACYLETMDNMVQAQHFYEKHKFIKTEDTLGNSGHTGCKCHYIQYFTL